MFKSNKLILNMYIERIFEVSKNLIRYSSENNIIIM